jgi:hypothetical protein
LAPQAGNRSSPRIDSDFIAPVKAPAMKAFAIAAMLHIMAEPLPRLVA